MAELLQNITCIAWLILAVKTFIGVRRWNKSFSELYDELRRQIEDGDTNG